MPESGSRHPFATASGTALKHVRSILVTEREAASLHGELDVMVLLDQPTAVGCILTARLIGVIEAEQTDEDGTKCRNDRLVAVATHAHIHGEVESLDQLDKKIVDEIEHFFVSYAEMRGKKFKPKGRFGPKRALKLLNSGRKAFKNK